jgi:hypothetical protein
LIASSSASRHRGVLRQEKDVDRSYPTDKGTRVRFRISDAFLPGPDDLPYGLSRDTETEGAIVDFSDSGLKPRAFAIVELEDGQTLVVSVNKLKLAKSDSPESEGG